VVEGRCNWRGADWEELVKMLAADLEQAGFVEGYASAEEVEAAIAELDETVWRCIKEHVPLSKISPHSIFFTR
jgi:mannitol/fructose-specific phosphotransferase system IIA component (Ntr-type)